MQIYPLMTLKCTRTLKIVPWENHSIFSWSNNLITFFNIAGPPPPSPYPEKERIFLSNLQKNLNVHIIFPPSHHDFKTNVLLSILGELITRCIVEVSRELWHCFEQWHPTCFNDVCLEHLDYKTPFSKEQSFHVWHLWCTPVQCLTITQIIAISRFIMAICIHYCNNKKEQFAYEECKFQCFRFLSL